jgi:hypothetical protein
LLQAYGLRNGGYLDDLALQEDVVRGLVGLDVPDTVRDDLHRRTVLHHTDVQRLPAHVKAVIVGLLDLLTDGEHQSVVHEGENDVLMVLVRMVSLDRPDGLRLDLEIGVGQLRDT